MCEHNLNQLIERSGMFKKEVAAKKGITPENLSRQLHGHTGVTLCDLDEYSKILDCHLAEIIFPGQQINVIGGWWVSEEDGHLPVLKSYKPINLNCEGSFKGANLKIKAKDFLLTGRYVGIANFDVLPNQSLPIGHPGTLCLINIDGAETKKFYQEDIGKFCVALVANGTLVAGELYPRPNGQFEFWLPEIGLSQVFSEIHWARSISSMHFGFDFSTLDESKFVGASNVTDLEQTSSTKQATKIVSQKSQGVNLSVVSAPINPDSPSSTEKKKVLLGMADACEQLFGQYNDNLRRRLKRWIKQGIIQAVQDGAKFYIPRAEIDRLAGGR